ncbi:IS110 family transposase [Streptosporangium sp. NBC_01495]|uniref:IS110 family transposase n=1 Tax=Streptosporangium sp. NBC_01495 TaxID=2903899 RepID=UPI002E3326EE|nr:IS110 family transposase [Streptosporangium sp. NBC_01495]
MRHAWAGIDIGKGHHHVVVIDSEGEQLLSQKVINDEPELLAVLDKALGLAEKITWAVDIRTGGAALVLALLAAQDQEVLYISSTMVNRAAGGYRGAAKTDARDAAIIADQARMRRGLTVIRPHEEDVVELRLLVARRRDLVADRTRMINRLREILLELWPALERTLDLTNHGPLVLLVGYQRPAEVRRLGVARLAAWLKARGVRRFNVLAATAVEAAKAQTVALPGERMASQLVAQLAQDLIALEERIDAVVQMIEERFHQHELAEIVQSLPGVGPILGAEFLAAIGGNLRDFAHAGHLAAHAGMSPVPRDSGRISGNMHRPHRYSRPLNRVFYMSALLSIRSDPESRRFYDRKRAEGKGHIQAVIALGRRRVNVLWALIRDGRCYDPTRSAQNRMVMTTQAA